MNREEHLEWCKVRAREYLKRGNPEEAVISMLSDLNKHEETSGIGEKLGMLGIFSCSSIRKAEQFIEGFN